MKPILSVIIPTINYAEREAQLRHILSALGNQDTSTSFEVIIVDNAGATDRNYTAFLPRFARLIREPKLGLSQARNAGTRASKGNIIAFLDDDVIPTSTWVQAITQTHKLSGVLCVGGSVIFEDCDSIQYPKWFSDYFLRFLAPPRFPKSTGTVVAPYYIIGANMSFKRSVFDRYGYFNVNLGRIGNRLLSGEDMEFMMRIPQKAIFYEPCAGVSTEITPRRLTRKYYTMRIFWQAVSDARIFEIHGFEIYYDRSELFFSIDFLKNLITTLRKGSLFQTFCMILRIIAFKATLFLKK